MKVTMKKWLALSMACLVTLSASALRGGTPDKDYLCLTANEYSEFCLKQSGSPTAVTLQTSTDGTNWSDYTIGTWIVLANAGDKVYFRNAADEVTDFSASESDYYYFSSLQDGSVAASGNVMSLVDKSCTTTTIPCDYCFSSLFIGFAIVLTSAPALPATTLAEGCYYQMFSGCEALTTAPELPATELAPYCYQDMFSGCTGLTAAPELPATGLVDGCYEEMFYGCSNLSFAKVNFTSCFDEIYTYCMLYDVASGGTLVCPGELSIVWSWYGIPYDWTVINAHILDITSETGWASMYTNLPVRVPTGVDVYYASAAEGSIVELMQIAVGTTMAPGTAVIVKGAPGTVTFPVSNATVTSYDDNLFQGSSVDVPCNAGENYVLNAAMSSDESVHFSIYTGTTLTHHKAWLPMSAVGGTGSIQFRFGDTTAISTTETEAAEDVVYNLAGQRVGSDYRGIVIKNGKKVFNK